MASTVSPPTDLSAVAPSPFAIETWTATETSLRPPLTLALGPAGAGKTERVFQRFLAGDRRTLLLAPSPQQAENYAERLAARAGAPTGEIQGRVVTFHGLIADIVSPAQPGDYRSIGRAFQRIALTSLLPDCLRPDDFLGRMLEAPGFITALAERIREWKLACVTPDLLEQAALAAQGEQGGALIRKTRELARLFRAYETFLMQNRLRDEADLLRLATEQVRDDLVPLPGNLELLLVDGFYRFNRAQRALLAAFAGRGLESGKAETEILVTLPYEEERPLLFAAPERTLQILRREFQTREERLPRRPPAVATPLLWLEQRLFAPAGEALSGMPAVDRPILLFDAPNPYVEAEMVAREFRRIHAAEGIAWSEFGIILRTLGDYAPILSAVFERYQIPLGVDGPEALVDNPLIKTALQLLTVFRGGWQRDDVLAVLKSGYTAPVKLAADRLRRRARGGSVRAGKANWLALNETESDVAVADTMREMARFDELFTGQRVTLDAFAELLREMIAAFGLEERILLGEPARQERDRSALKEALNILEALTEMAGLARRGPMRFVTFHDELLVAWQNASSVPPTGDDVVRVAEPYDSRERPLRVAAVMGLTERVFPRRVTEDPFLRDDERALLRSAGLDLEAQKGRTDDERLFFYLAITAPSEHLLLSYPRASDESDTLPSFYLDEVRAVLTTAEAGGLKTISRTLADVAPRPEEAVSDSDQVLAACADLFDPGSEADPARRLRRMEQAAQRMRSCLESETMGPSVRAVVASRALPGLPRLADLAIRADFAGRNRVFSVSELETYRRCPFQYLLRHVLRIASEEEESSPRTQGTILHSVLRRYFRRRIAPAPPLSDTPADLETMRGELNALLTETLETENLDAGPHRLRMTHRLLADALDRFAERELRFTTQFGMRPTHLELAFGVTDGKLLDEEDRRNESSSETLDAEGASPYDSASCAEPLLIAAQDGGSPVAICGTIDRVDLDPTGRRALVLDYKLGKPPDYAEMQRGASLQMPLYLLAVERLFGLHGAVACYDSMQERGRRRLQRLEHINLRQFGPILPLDDARTVTPLNRDQYAELVRTAETSAVQAARAIGSAQVEAIPGEHCRFCAFGDVCRTTLTGGHDGEFIPITSLTAPPP